MKLLLPILALITIWAMTLSPIQIDNNDYQVYATRRREPTVNELIDHYFADVKVAAYRIFKCESGFNTYATNHNSNGTVDRGIAQINSVHSAKVHGDLDSLYDPKVNIRVARQIYDSSGWSPWVCKG